jgi:ubiquinone/menaquinone biosynthesis C-methylase UbiE
LSERGFGEIKGLNGYSICNPYHHINPPKSTFRQNKKHHSLMASNYNKIARSYDLISWIVYGKALINAQVGLLKYIPANSRVLIVGGGTGWILEEIAQIHSGLTIDYIESSEKMIALSEKRDHGTNHINFINLPVENYITEERYDVIFTPFFFDNFKVDKIEFVFTKLNELLKQDGIWLYADFIDNGKWWQKLLLRTMYLFFKITTNIETQELVDMDEFFDPYYNKSVEICHYHNFIRSVVYRKK